MQAVTPKVWGSVQLDCTSLGTKLCGFDLETSTCGLSQSEMMWRLLPVCRYAETVFEGCLSQDQLHFESLHTREHGDTQAMCLHRWLAARAPGMTCLKMDFTEPRWQETEAYDALLTSMLPAILALSANIRLDMSLTLSGEPCMALLNPASPLAAGYTNLLEDIHRLIVERLAAG